MVLFSFFSGLGARAARKTSMMLKAGNAGKTFTGARAPDRGRQDSYGA